MYNDTENRFVLERYRSGGSNRYVCPQCGRKKCFTRYVDLETGKYVADECGKCDHTASCGYHYPPRQYFHDHPELNCKKDYQTEYVMVNPCWDWETGISGQMKPETERCFPVRTDCWCNLRIGDRPSSSAPNGYRRRC